MAVKASHVGWTMLVILAGGVLAALGCYGGPTAAGIGFAVFAVAAIAIAWRASASFNRDLSRLADSARKLRDGDSETETMDVRNATLAPMKDALAEARKAQQDRTRAMETLSNGDLGVDIALSSDRDALGKAMRETRERLSHQADLVQAVAYGDLSGASQQFGEKDRMGQTIRIIARNLKSRADLAQRIAGGDLTVKVKVFSEKDTLGTALRDMVDSLRDVIAHANKISEQVATAVGELASSSRHLAQGANQQASALAQVSTAVEEMATQTKSNVESANQANQLSVEAKNQADTGNNQMRQMSDGLMALNDVAQNIQKISKVIDNIAFQTNLLALNAAVEAARAGRHGKGFAVVAEEVRNLAGNSAESAKEIEELIKESVGRAEDGVKLASHASQGLAEIIKSTQRLVQLISDVASASSQQAEGIAQVNQGLSHISQVTQQNTTTAEQTSTSAQELRRQADELRAAFNHFKIDAGEAMKSVRAGEEGQLAKRSNHLVSPSEVISLDDEKFGRF